MTIAQSNAPVPEPAQSAQPPQVSPSLTPGALYKQAMHPLEVVRSSMNNWSDSETAAFLVGVRMAKDACEQTPPENYSGQDLYDLARLCSLGQDWNAANTAATRYLDSRAEPFRTQAYALSINALMHLNGTDLAVTTANTMMENQPYDAEVAYAVRYLKDALEQKGSPEAVPLAENEHARIVKALEAGVALKAVHGDAVMSLGVLYESAMDLAFWQRYRHDDAAAAATVKDIDDALAKTPPASAENARRTDAVRAQYALLGQPLPALKTTPVAAPPKTKAKTAATQRAMQIGPDYGAATVLVLFPDWCPQCRKMMTALTEFGAANKDKPVYAYGLMFLEDPAGQDQAPDAAAVSHEQNLKEMEGTSTLLVDAKVAHSLGVLDFPLGIVLDHEGRVRYVGVLPDDAFNGNGYMEKVLGRMTGGVGAPGQK
ncbi:peroxiredoxin family protein [Occallatibacter riparius]|uniref:Peroxiredoxin family protein n=1 Tax=Occallatibacter riparius TaxID=1002689 RepID=A0A9J7BLH7_9BACT|nr:peroxiredoxin family protein [Occallatibacter riparius]UWZ83507.1 peroxiredoxin family protein [Occallatibacter riparius]